MAEQRARRSSSEASGTGTRTRPHPQKVSGAEDAAIRATRSLGKLTGLTAQGCSEIAPTDDDGWLVSVDVVEVARIPDTTSLMATYEVELAEDGSLRSYRRVRRYCRGVADS